MRFDTCWAGWLDYRITRVGGLHIAGVATSCILGGGHERR